MADQEKELIPWPRLGELRVFAGNISQSALDEKIGRARGTTLQIERGKLLPPDRKTCDKIDEVLGREVGALWAEAAPARLQRLDPDLYEWHRTQVEQAGGRVLTPDEQRMLELMRNASVRELLGAVRALHVAWEQRTQGWPDEAERVRTRPDFAKALAAFLWSGSPASIQDLLKAAHSLPSDQRATAFEVIAHQMVGMHELWAAGRPRKVLKQAMTESGISEEAAEWWLNLD